MKKFPNGLDLSKKDVSEHLKQKGWVLDEGLTKILCEDVYFDNSGRILHQFFEGKGVLYDDGAAFRDAILAIANQRPQHLLVGLFDYDRRFLEDIPSLVGGLIDTLKLGDDYLDYQWRRLDDLDRVLRGINRSRLLKPDLFAMVIAYTGEVFRRQVGGVWVMKYIEDDSVWEPWVAVGDIECAVFSIVYNEIYEAHPRMSLSGSFFGELKSFERELG